jgi:hypothetical protein
MELDPRFLMLVAIVVVFVLLIFGGRRGAGADMRRMCRSCGAAHPSFARYCRRCGKRL